MRTTLRAGFTFALLFFLLTSLAITTNTFTASQSHIVKGFFFFNSALTVAINFTVEDISLGPNNIISGYSQDGFYEVDLADLPLGWRENDVIIVHVNDRLGNVGQAMITVNSTMSFQWGNITLHPAQLATFRGDYVELVVPSWYAQMVEEYEMVKVLDQAFLLEKNLVKTYPPLFYDGTTLARKQAFAYNNNMDGGAGSGNPVQIGPGWFIIVNGSGSYVSLPRWFVFLHEMGHNWEISPSYYNLIPEGGTELVSFNEGFASLTYLYVVQMFEQQTDHFGVRANTYDHIMAEYSHLSGEYREAFENWKTNGSIYDQLGPYEVDGMFLELIDLHGWILFENFFKIFVGLDDILGPSLNTTVKARLRPSNWQNRVTFIETAFNVASEKNLTSYFQSLSFPFNQTYSQEIEPILKEALHVQLPTLTVTITLNPTNIESGADVSINVHVTDGTMIVEDAYVQLVSDKGGSFTQSSGYTDSNGDFSTTFMAPNVVDETNLRITVTASKNGYTDGSDYNYVTVYPLGTLLLSVTITANPNTLQSGETSTIMVRVTDGTNPISAATVALSLNKGGTLSPTSGKTNADGYFTSTYTAPSVTTDTIITITTNATKLGYIDGQNHTRITVKPGSPTQEDSTLWTYLAILVIISATTVGIATIARRKRHKPKEEAISRLQATALLKP